jgi:hypothetical protein
MLIFLMLIYRLSVIKSVLKIEAKNSMFKGFILGVSF